MDQRNSDLSDPSTDVHYINLEVTRAQQVRIQDGGNIVYKCDFLQPDPEFTPVPLF